MIRRYAVAGTLMATRRYVIRHAGTFTAIDIRAIVATCAMVDAEPRRRKI